MARPKPRSNRLSRLIAGAGTVLLAAGLTQAVTPAATASPAGDAGRDPALLGLISRMSLEEKAGQLFVPHVYGETADTTNPADVANNQRVYGVNNGAELIRKYHLGGVIYYAWSNNVNNPEQIAGLSNGLQRAALSSGPKLPLLVTTDQEGGLIARVGPPATQFPGAMALAAGRRTGDAATAARISGTELRAIGIHSPLAPDADVNINPANPVIGIRSFGSDTKLVSRMVAAQSAGYEQAGVIASPKHFPGHGDTDVDSHLDIPEITHTREQMNSIDLPPFRAAIKSGTDMVMTGHLEVPALDPTSDSATVSRPIITGVLREQLGFDGLVVTDALDMDGLRLKYGDEEIPVRVINAGADILLKSPETKFDLQYRSVLNAVRSGTITQARLNEAVYRMLRLKKRYGVFKKPFVDESKVGDVVGTKPHLAAAQRMTDHTTTLVKNDDSLLPLSAEARSVLVTGALTAAPAEAIAKRGGTVDPLATGTNPNADRIASAVAAAKEHDLTVVTTNRATLETAKGQRDLVSALLGTGKPVIVVAVRDPYDINAFTAAPTYVATYSATPVAMESLARVLFGERSPGGKLPVSIPTADGSGELYPFGHGLSY
ncbi:MAG: glycoside hydrolase family 3 protein [Streptosporangiales bacterium]|nr:glycoside hydrolase family 3 protein [Streptosporangiales bacterium]